MAAAFPDHYQPHDQRRQQEQPAGDEHHLTVGEDDVRIPGEGVLVARVIPADLHIDPVGKQQHGQDAADQGGSPHGPPPSWVWEIGAGGPAAAAVMPVWPGPAAPELPPGAAWPAPGSAWRTPGTAWPSPGPAWPSPCGALSPGSANGSAAPARPAPSEGMTETA